MGARRMVKFNLAKSLRLARREPRYMYGNFRVPIMEDMTAKRT
jgi:hypothetical protein